MRVIIVSDFHLKTEPEAENLERYDRVLSFLKSLIGNTDILIMNGDIFDLWFVWKEVIIKRYFPILKVLADLQENGCRLIFIAGNHDFWFRDFLTNYLNIEVYPDNFTETIDDRKILVTHGDMHTSNDQRYRVFRSLVRNRFLMKLFEIFHPDIAVKLGGLLSRSSRKKRISQNLMIQREKGLISFARKQFEYFDIVAMAHSHLPKLIAFDNRYYANSGDWIQNNSYLEMIDGQIKLNSWNSQFLKPNPVKTDEDRKK
jgi:UDP-2,3-diacylglucosamine hydrolase